MVDSTDVGSAVPGFSRTVTFAVAVEPPLGAKSVARPCQCGVAGLVVGDDGERVGAAERRELCVGGVGEGAVLVDVDGAVLRCSVTV